MQSKERVAGVLVINFEALKRFFSRAGIFVLGGGRMKGTSSFRSKGTI